MQRQEEVEMRGIIRRRNGRFGAPTLGSFNSDRQLGDIS